MLFSNSLTKDEQIRFVEGITDIVKDDIILKIQQDKIPKEWNGVELRQYIYDKFGECVQRNMMDKKRKQNYNNEILVNNL